MRGLWLVRASRNARSPFSVFSEGHVTDKSAGSIAFTVLTAVLDVLQFGSDETVHLYEQRSLESFLMSP